MAEEKTFSVGVQTSSPKRISVTSNVSENPITASADTGLYYSQLSKNWAIGEGLIQNEDYSSKTWAAESKSSADLSKMYSEAASLDYNNLSDSINQYNEQISGVVADGLYNINTSVTGGVETIETLQANSIAEITTNKESALSDITTAKTNALTNIETNLNNATSEINTNRANTLAQISTLANTSISDINATAKSYDNLTHKNITNCLLEIPQRIKLELNNGVLTLKAGSVVIVPNGTEDLTSKYPVGATFINDNFKVYDRQFVDGNFFVWVELLSDYSHSKSGGNGTYIVTISPKANTLVGREASTQTSSGTTIGANNMHYHTDVNKVSVYLNSAIEVEDCALPMYIMTRTTTEVTSINQVFNGFGYIGSTVWVDKGVKGLISNGRNEDGSLKNAEFVTKQLFTYTIPNFTQKGVSPCLYMDYPTNPNIIYNGEIKGVDYIGNIKIGGTPLSADWWFDVENNYWKYNGVISRWIPFGLFDLTNGAISNFQPKQPFRAVDYSELGSIISKTNPDYSRAIQIQPHYTCPSDGYVVLQTVVAAKGNEPSFYINNLLVSHFHNVDSGNVRWGGGMFKVSKGDYLDWGYWAGVYFIPEKGV